MDCNEPTSPTTSGLSVAAGEQSADGKYNRKEGCKRKLKYTCHEKRSKATPAKLNQRKNKQQNKIHKNRDKSSCLSLPCATAYTASSSRPTNHITYVARHGTLPSARSARPLAPVHTAATSSRSRCLHDIHTHEHTREPHLYKHPNFSNTHRNHAHIYIQQYFHHKTTHIYF